MDIIEETQITFEKIESCDWECDQPHIPSRKAWWWILTCRCYKLAICECLEAYIMSSTPKRGRDPEDNGAAAAAALAAASKKLNLSASPKAGNSKSAQKAQVEVASPVKDEAMEAVGGEDSSTETEDLSNEQIASIEADITIADDQNNQGATSYADAVGKKQNKDYLYCLYVQQGQDKREPISRNHFMAFEKEIWSKRFSMTPEENGKVIIDWTYWRYSMGIIAATDEFTANWVKELASQFEFQGFKTRAWSRWERAEALVFSGYLHGDIWKSKQYKSKYLLNSILKMNGLKGDFEALVWKHCPNGVWTSFEPKGPLIGSLSGKKKLNAGICTLNLRMRVRKQKTKADVLGQQNLTGESESS